MDHSAGPASLADPDVLSEPCRSRCADQIAIQYKPIYSMRAIRPQNLRCCVRLLESVEYNGDTMIQAGGLLSRPPVKSRTSVKPAMAVSFRFLIRERLAN